MGLCLLAVGPRDCCHRRVQIPSSMGKGEASCLACQRRRDAREAEGSNRLWDSLWPTAEDERPAAKRQKLTQPWKSKKRKRRSDAGNTRSPAQVSFTASKRRRLLLRSPLQKPKLAKAPASEALQASTSPQRGPDRCSLAQRVAAGRTLELLTTLMAKSHSCSPEEVSLLSGTISQCSF